MPKVPGTLSASNTGLFHKAPTAFTGYTSLKSLQAFQGFQRWALKSVPNTIWELSQLVPCKLPQTPSFTRGRCFPLHSEDLAIKTHLPSCKSISHPGGVGEGLLESKVPNSPRLHGIFGSDGPVLLGNQSGGVTSAFACRSWSLWWSARSRCPLCTSSYHTRSAAG